MRNALLGSLMLLTLLGCEGAFKSEPAARSGARLTVVVDDKGTAVATLANLGSEQLGYGYPYEVEVMSDSGEWDRYKISCAWILPLVFLRPGEEYEQEIHACRDGGRRTESLPPGLYRLTKGIEIIDTRERMDLMEEFVVPGG